MTVRVVWTSHVFDETSVGIQDVLLLLGIDSSGDISTTNDNFETTYPNHQTTLFVILGFHKSMEQLPDNFIAVQMEQSGSKWFSKRYVERLSRARIVWDFSISNVTMFKKMGLTNIHFIPTRVPMCPFFDFNKIKPVQDIDVLFYGAKHQRRSHIENLLKRKGLQVVFRYYNLFGKDRDDLIHRSKVVLNIHYYMESSLETHRIEYLCSKGKCVLSEYSNDHELDNLYKGSVHFCKYDEIVSKAYQYCKNETLRHNLEVNSYLGCSRRQFDKSHVRESLK